MNLRSDWISAIIRVIRPPNNLNKCGAAKWIRFFLVSRNRQNALWAKHSSPVRRQKRMPQTRASFCISSLNFTSLLALIRILLFPFLQLLLSLFAGVEFLNFGHEKSGEGINNGLWQFDLIWILTFFLAGHSVLPQQQNLAGSTQSISRSFPAIHSCQRLFPCTEGEQIISKPEKILIELLSHPFPSGVFAGKARTK